MAGALNWGGKRPREVTDSPAHRADVLVPPLESSGTGLALGNASITRIATVPTALERIGGRTSLERRGVVPSAVLTDSR